MVSTDLDEMAGGAEHASFETVRSLELPAQDYAIFGSGPLLVRGIIEDANDIDIICRGGAWRHAQQLGEMIYLDDYEIEVVSIDNQKVTIGTSWGIGQFDIDELIDTAEEINGLPFVQLRFVVEYKTIGGRPKDIRHLDLLRSSGYLE